MRFVTKDLSDKPAILESQKTFYKLDEISMGAGVLDIYENYFQDVYKDAEGKRQMYVRDKLNFYYLYKCAYCERNCKAEIEHYRPKAGVTEDKTHPGYYWLCYEWSNLLPSCHECNASGGKQNQFPIAGIRAVIPPRQTSGQLDPAQMLAHHPPLVDEQPYLLHPEIDDPTVFLGVEIDLKGEGLRLCGTDGPNERGEQTIKICNLNRIDLKINRFKKLSDFIKEINFTFVLLIEETIKLDELEKSLISSFRLMDTYAKDEHAEYTLLLRSAMSNENQFSGLVLPRLELSQRAIVLAAFTEYRALNPF